MKCREDPKSCYPLKTYSCSGVFFVYRLAIHPPDDFKENYFQTSSSLLRSDFGLVYITDKTTAEADGGLVGLDRVRDTTTPELKQRRIFGPPESRYIFIILSAT